MSVASGFDDAAARRTVEAIHAGSGQPLFGFARRLGLTDDEAQEVVQETMLRLWRELRGGAAIEDAVAWAFRALYRLAMDRHRVSRRWQAFVERLVPGAPSASRDRDDLAAVWQEVDRLPMRQRQVLYLHYRADLTFEAIGTILAIEPSSARAASSRALATLRLRLREV